MSIEPLAAGGAVVSLGLRAVAGVVAMPLAAEGAVVSVGPLTADGAAVSAGPLISAGVAAGASAVGGVLFGTPF